MNKLSLIIILTSLLFACKDSKTTLLSAQSIVYCAEGSPENFNPQTITSTTTTDATAKQLYNRLITFQSEENTLSPSLAKSWHMTNDGKMITFYLRKNVEFHQTKYFKPTRPFNADDVLFSFKRVLDKNHPFHNISGGKYPFFQSVKFNKIIKKIEKINDYTIRFQLHHANSTFIANLATDYAVILSAEYAEQLTKKNSQQQIDLLPIGTGPFKLQEYRVGSLIRYYRHEKYWQKNISLEQLVFDITPSNAGRLTKLLTNECDVIAYPIAHKKIIKHKELSLNAVTSFNVGYLGFNTQKPPFDNKLLRQAVAYAINKKSLVDAIYFGNAEVAKSLLPKSSWAYDENTIEQEFSIDKAKSLLIEAGYPKGFTMDIWPMPVQRAYNPNSLTMAKLIQADLKKIGITVNIIDSYELTSFLHKIDQGEHQSVLLGWTADHPDPDNFFTPLLSCSSQNRNNRAYWCNNTFDLLLQQSLETTNIKTRKAYYAQALAIIAEELPLLPIAHSKRFQARNNNVKGQILHAFGGIDFSQVSKR